MHSWIIKPVCAGITLFGMVSTLPNAMFGNFRPWAGITGLVASGMFTLTGLYGVLWPANPRHLTMAFAASTAMQLVTFAQLPNRPGKWT